MSKTEKNGEQWAKVPAWIAEVDIDATALRVYLVVAARAGRSRRAWPGRAYIAARVGRTETAVGYALRRCEAAGLLRRAGRHVVDSHAGTWTWEWEVVDEQADGNPSLPTATRPDGNLARPDGNPALPPFST